MNVEVGVEREGEWVPSARSERERVSEMSALQRGSRGAETNSIASGRGGSGDGRGLISTAVARSSPFAAATAIRRARGRSQEADRPRGSRDRKRQGASAAKNSNLGERQSSVGVLLSLSSRASFSCHAHSNHLKSRVGRQKGILNPLASADF